MQETHQAPKKRSCERPCGFWRVYKSSHPRPSRGHRSGCLEVAQWARTNQHSLLAEHLCRAHDNSNNIHKSGWCTAVLRSYHLWLLCKYPVAARNVVSRREKHASDKCTCDAVSFVFLHLFKLMLRLPDCNLGRARFSGIVRNRARNNSRNEILKKK